MGKEREASSTTINQSTTPTPTAEETALNKLDLEARQANQQGLINVQGQSLNLAELLLKGQGLPGYLGTLPGGIDENTTQSIVDKSLRDIQPSFQQSGLLDSGVRASVSARTAGDIRRNSAEFNLNNLLQLLNLATGNAAQVQQPVLAQSADLGGRLAGLRSTQSTGTQDTMKTSMNPFMKSFQQGMGTGLSKFLVGG